MGSSSLAGLATLYRRNPYDERLKTTAGMLDRSGMAKSLLMGRMGELTRQAEDYDTESAATISGLYRENMNQANETALMKDADEAMKAAVDLAKQDPIAATQYFNARAERNKFIPKGITFRRSMDRKSIMEVKDAKGAQRGIINATDMLDEARAAEQQKGGPLTDEERGGLANKYFYPVPGYEKQDGEEGSHKVGDTRTIGRTVKGKPQKVTEEYQGKEKGWVERGDIPAFAPREGDEGGGGRVKTSDTKALKIEVARKFAPTAIKQIQAKGAAATPKELRAVKAIKAFLSNVDPLTKDFNPDSVYAALAEAGDEYAAAFDRVLLDAEDAFPKTKKAARAVDDALNLYHRRRKTTAPAKPPDGGSDWRKYLKPGKK